jgi:hypothetical protein
METWKLIWQVCLIGSMLLFAGMAIATTIGGLADIRKLLSRLRDLDTGESDTEDADTEE